MPFDSTTLRRPTVTVLPPQPPERSGGPQRIHIEIEIVDRRAPLTQVRGDHRFGTVTLWIIACALLALLLGCAKSWTQYQLGGMTFYRSDDGTTGSSYELDGTTYSQFVGPDGKIKRCSSKTFTDCD